MEQQYRLIWDYYLWNFTVEDMHNALQANQMPMSVPAIRDALKAMKDKLAEVKFEDMREEELRLYLARNYQHENELLELYLQAKNDYNLLRSGQTRYPDGSKPMPVDIKTLMGLLAAIEKQGQARASLVAKLGAPPPPPVSQPIEDQQALPGVEEDGESMEDFMSSLRRRPEDVIDVSFVPSEG